jgi:hypothetical protein
MSDTSLLRATRRVRALLRRLASRLALGADPELEALGGCLRNDENGFARFSRS